MIKAKITISNRPLIISPGNADGSPITGILYFQKCNGGSGGVVVTLSQEDYDSLKPKIANTLYAILSASKSHIEKLFIGELPFGTMSPDGKFDYYKFPFILK